MNMNRKRWICLFSFVLLLIIGEVLFCKISKEKENHSEEYLQEIKMEEESVVSSKEEVGYQFIIFSENGRLVVYESDGKTVYLHSGIMEHDLPDRLKKKLPFGLRFYNDTELFDFLESYSS